MQMIVIILILQIFDLILKCNFGVLGFWGRSTLYGYKAANPGIVYGAPTRMHGPTSPHAPAGHVRGNLVGLRMLH